MIEEIKMKNTRTLNDNGTTTIEVETTITVWLTVPTEQADLVEPYEFQDQIDYLVSEAADDLVGSTLDPVEADEWTEDGAEVVATHEVSATIEAVGY